LIASVPELVSAPPDLANTILAVPLASTPGQAKVHVERARQLGNARRCQSNLRSRSLERLLDARGHGSGREVRLSVAERDHGLTARPRRADSADVEPEHFCAFCHERAAGRARHDRGMLDLQPRNVCGNVGYGNQALADTAPEWLRPTSAAAFSLETTLTRVLRVSSYRFEREHDPLGSGI
jgi:hypothetical protein